LSQAAQVLGGAGAELGDQALLGSRQMGGGPLIEESFSKRSAPSVWPRRQQRG